MSLSHIPIPVPGGTRMSTPAGGQPVTATDGAKNGIPLNATLRKFIWLGIAIAAGLGFALLPTPHQLSPTAQRVLGILLFSAIMWAAQVMNNGVTAVLMMGLMILVGVRPPLALSGFSGGPYWILVAVLFYGCAMKKTGLAERISYYILTLFPATYSGILGAFFVIGFALALGIPSMTVRTAIMVPIAWAMIQSLGLSPRSRGSALILLTTVEMAVVPGLAFLTGSLNGPVVVAAFEAKHLSLTWGGYAQVLAFPTLLLCVLILLANHVLLRPEVPLNASGSFARDRLNALGSFRRPELITAIVVSISIGLWATDRYHHVPSFVIGMFALAIFALAGIIRDEDIGTGVSWTLLLFLGGIFGMANVIQEYKVANWLAGFFVPIAQTLIFSSVVVLVVAALVMLVFRFVDPSAFIAIPVIFLAISDVTSRAGIPPMVLMAPLLLASAPFWLSYQNFWLAMGEAITANQAFSARDRVRLATVYATLAIVTVATSVVYWKLIGLLK
jgi:DASS family divalent anion:Na+ symporter